MMYYSSSALGSASLKDIPAASYWGCRGRGGKVGGTLRGGYKAIKVVPPFSMSFHAWNQRWNPATIFVLVYLVSLLNILPSFLSKFLFRERIFCESCSSLVEVKTWHGRRQEGRVSCSVW